MADNRDPFRRKAARPDKLTPINPEFRDIKDEKDLLNFINKHKDTIKNRDAEIDNLEAEIRQDTEYEPAPRQNFNTVLRQREQSFNRPIIEEYLEEQESLDSEEKLSINTSSQSNHTKPPELDDFLKNIKMDGLPQEAIDRIKAARSKEISEPNKTISNVSSTSPQKAPTISNVQMRRKIESEMREAAKSGQNSLDVPKTQARFSIKSPSNAINVDWIRFEPVSGCIFYNQSEIFVRRFNLIDTNRVTNAMEAEDISAFIDALGNCIQEPFNIRDMTYTDFRHLLYFHWFNSYSKLPHDLEWRSKYGNTNLYTVSESNLKLITPKISKIEYMEWVYQGYTVPTVRDMEVFVKEDLTNEEESLLSRAQYFAGDPLNPSIQSKIDNMSDLCANSTESLQNLGKFKKAIYHEIVESVDVLDAKFDPHAWITVLKGQVKIVENERKHYESMNDSLSALSSEDERIDLETEIERLETGIKNLKEGESGVVLADVETIRLDRPTLRFFPTL